MIFDLYHGQIVSGTKNECLYWGDDWLHFGWGVDTCILFNKYILATLIKALTSVNHITRNIEIQKNFFGSIGKYTFYVEPGDFDSEDNSWHRNIMICTENVVVTFNLKEQSFPVLIQFLKEKNFDGT